MRISKLRLTVLALSSAGTALGAAGGPAVAAVRGWLLRGPWDTAAGQSPAAGASGGAAGVRGKAGQGGALLGDPGREGLDRGAAGIVGRGELDEAQLGEGGRRIAGVEQGAGGVGGGAGPALGSGQQGGAQPAGVGEGGVEVTEVTVDPDPVQGALSLGQLPSGAGGVGRRARWWVISSAWAANS